MIRRIKYIYVLTDWPNFNWDEKKLINQLSTVRNLQGRLIGKMSNIGFDLQNHAILEILTQDAVKSNEIEGEFLNSDQVRSSLARKLGIDVSGLVDSPRNVDGVVEMLLDATMKFENPLNKDRLCEWHKSLFPTGYSGLYEIIVGDWRDDASGPMIVVSGTFTTEKVHFQAPDAAVIESEMKHFFDWLNKEQDIDLVIKSALAHLWFITIHPFDDGNGRIVRAIADMILSRSDGQSMRFYSMSAQIMKERSQYYDILERTQKGSLDITEWIEWYLNCLRNAIESSEEILRNVIRKNNFWLNNSSVTINTRQRKIINLLLDGFKGKLTSTKWSKICKCSQDTALRDIQYLIGKHILYKLSGGGRSTAYDLLKEE